jgi:Ser/Thr protein kinase RdoA (MazF antagonist)
MKVVIESIPDGDTFVHGDFHSKNIMVQKGEYLLIDMGDIGYGNPAFDLAVIKTCLDISAKHMPPEIVMSAYGMTPEVCEKYYNAFCESYGGDEKLWENAAALSRVRHTLWRAINNRG